MSLSAKELALFYGAKAKVADHVDHVYDKRLHDEVLAVITSDIITIDHRAIHAVEKGVRLKPILRPLSMDVLKSFDKEKGFYNKTYFATDGTHQEKIPMEDAKFLIDKHVDLFGWIDQDKAISALELEPNPYE